MTKQKWITHKKVSKGLATLNLTHSELLNGRISRILRHSNLGITYGNHRSPSVVLNNAICELQHIDLAPLNNLMNAQKLFLALGTTAVYFSTISLAYADSFNMGEVQQKFPIDTICTSFLADHKTAVLVTPFPEESEPVITWMNINGQDIQLQQVSLQVSKKGDSSVAEYRSQDIAVTVNYQIFPEEDFSQKTSEKISVNYKGQRKTINTTGLCTWQ
jgi:hypothetical protein